MLIIDKDRAHFLIQSVPMYSTTKLAQIVKNSKIIIARNMFLARNIFQKFPNLKKALWGAEFWNKSYFISSVEKHGHENKMINKMINYIIYKKNQGIQDIKEYKQIHSGQLETFLVRYYSDTSELVRGESLESEIKELP